MNHSTLSLIFRALSLIGGLALMYLVYWYSSAPGIPSDQHFALLFRVAVVAVAVALILAALRVNRHD